MNIIKQLKVSGLALLTLVGVCLLSMPANAQKGKQHFYQLKVYQLKNKSQVERVEAYLANAYIPALHDAGIKNVGVFKPVSDTAALKIYVFIPYQSLAQYDRLPELLAKDKKYLMAGKEYLDARYQDAPYVRIQSILLKSFSGMTFAEAPKLSSAKKERIYELRSYEGPTEKYYESKVDMFNKGDEIGLFKRLGFNAIFYGDVISGMRMPNLMYMTSFNNMKERDEHWKAFFEDAHWKKISAMPEYQNNVSRGDTWFLYPTDYSDF
jgi:hypothetical protein